MANTTILLRTWDPATLAPDPSTIALRMAFFDASRVIYAGGKVPMAVFVPPVVTQSVAGVAEPPPPRLAMQITSWQTFWRPLKQFFDPAGPAALPAAVQFTSDSTRAPLPGSHAVLAHAVCAGDEDLASLRVVQSVMRTDVKPFPAPREFIQRFRVPVQVELRWVELAFGEVFAPYFQTAGTPAPLTAATGPTTLAIMDGADLPVPVPEMPNSMVEAPFDFGWQFQFDGAVAALDRSPGLRSHRHARARSRLLDLGA